MPRLRWPLSRPRAAASSGCISSSATALSNRVPWAIRVQPSSTLPMLANENWHNAHNFYGDLSDLQAQARNRLR